MPRLMSVAFTEAAVRERRKTVTRRKGWWTDKRGRRLLAPGDRLTLCRKVMGRKKGEPLVRVAEVEVVSIRRESLMCLGNCICHPDGHGTYAAEEMVREGFPGMDPVAFVLQFFTKAQGIGPADDVTRIEWRYLDDMDAAREIAPTCGGAR
jgi:hypothetical protein